MRRARVRNLVLVAALGTALVGCGGGEESAENVEKTEEAVRAEEGEELSPDPEAEQVEITAVEYEFENMPPTVGAGRVSFIMQNDGDEPHFMALAQLEEGVTVEEVLEAEAAGENPNQLIEREVGFSRTAKPGDESVLNANLEPGTYGMVCFIEAPDGKPHALKGMIADFEVVEES